NMKRLSETVSETESKKESRILTDSRFFQEKSDDQNSKRGERKFYNPNDNSYDPTDHDGRMRDFKRRFSREALKWLDDEDRRYRSGEHRNRTAVGRGPGGDG